MFALVVRRERLETELGHQLVHPVLGGPDPLTSELDRSSAGGDTAFGATADPVTRLEDDHISSSRDQSTACGEAAQAGPHDDHPRLLTR